MEDLPFSIPAGGGILVISYVGYDPYEIAVNKE